MLPLFFSLFYLLNLFDFGISSAFTDRYNIQKANITNLLNPGTTHSYFSDGLFAISNTLSSSDDKTTLNDWINSVENGIIQNASITPAQTKLIKISTALNQFSIEQPTIFSNILFKNISLWGPICNFLYISDEYNIDAFWDYSTTAGSTTDCKIYDILLDLTIDNARVHNSLYLQNIPCSMSFSMISRMVNIIYDFPDEYRAYLLNLILPNGITFNQFLRIAQAYYPTGQLTCFRILEMVGNYMAANISTTNKGQAKNVYNSLVQQIVLGTTTDAQCLQILSDQLVKFLDLSFSSAMTIFPSIYWEIPFGSVYDNIIFNECQISLLKSKAPSFYT